MDNKRKLRAVFFRTEAGREPVREWISTFDEAVEKEIYNAISAVRTDWMLCLRKRLVKKLEADLWEVRVNIRKRTARVVFTMEDHEIILLHGFMKKSRRIPRQHLRLARERMALWQKRRAYHE